MKFIMTIATVVLIGFSAEARTVKLSGELARALIDVSSAWGGSEAGMGHIYAQLVNINCLKTVDDTKSIYEIRCSATPPSGVTTVVSNQNQVDAEAASQLRRILIQLLGLDKKTSPTTRQLNVKSMKCQAMSLGHELDSLDLNPSATCTIRQ